MVRWLRPTGQDVPGEWQRVADGLWARRRELAREWGMSRSEAVEVVEETIHNLVADSSRRNRIAARYVLDALGHSGAEEWPELAIEEFDPRGCQAHYMCGYAREVGR